MSGLSSLRGHTMPSSSALGGAKVHEEKILVTVRVRPLNRKELSLYDLIAWDFPDEHTISLKNTNGDFRTAAYMFDNVFGPTCSSQKVYENGARDVALSVLSGINATIFAYGQTSSGKTFTMKAIADNAIKDIYEHINSNPQKEFILKISALEIYNENVFDLLNHKCGSLRLLDDPEKGTVVEKLVEEVVNDGQHLGHLIHICEDERKIGETDLNDKSSRSHQIIKLTVESSTREKSGHVKSLLGSLNLVDLAGSERASQTNADGTRLKEGSHINRSLLTLMTVIRKLSCGRSGHIPYRDSKLTRILQPSLGGNARTAIICTLSPALSHMEQSRNTLSFATRAREVTNSARINMVVSDKRLVKNLKKEVARLEAELKSPGASNPSCLRTLLKEKDFQIQQMEKEMRELKRQRDLAHSLLEIERKAKRGLKVTPKTNFQSLSHPEPSNQAQTVRRLLFSTDGEPVFSETTPMKRRGKTRRSRKRKSASSTDPAMLVQEIRKLELQQRHLGTEANRALDVLQKEIASHKLGNQDVVQTIAKLLSEIKEAQETGSAPKDLLTEDMGNLKDEIDRLDSNGVTIASLEKKLDDVQKSIDNLVLSLSGSRDTDESSVQLKKKKPLPFGLSNSTNIQNLIWSPCSPLSSKQVGTEENEQENKASDTSLYTTDKSATPVVNCDHENTWSAPPVRIQSKSVSVKKMQKMFKNAAEENIQSIRSYVTELKERVAKLQYQKQLLVCQVLELETNEEATVTATEESDTRDSEASVPWELVFGDQRKQIVMLWHLCHSSIIHRTQFFLLFKGDPADKIYMEVELARLTWLEQQLGDLGNASPALLGDDPAAFVTSRIRALRQERECLAKKVSKLPAEEREELYQRWEIQGMGKQRRITLLNKVWTDPYCDRHVVESADVVARLVGFYDSGDHVSKEMFQLNFVSPSDRKPWTGWNIISNFLRF